MPHWVALAIVFFGALVPFVLLRLKNKFIAASNIKDAVKVAGRLSRDGFVPIINLIGEHYHSAKKTDKVVDQYRRLIDLLAKSKIKGRVSVKPTQIGLARSKDDYYQNLIAIIRRSNTHSPRIPVEIDMESARYKCDTLTTFLELPREFDARQAVQVYFFESSEKDVEALLGSNKKIRLVKGAYAEGDLTPAQVDEQMINCSEHLLLCANDPAIATVRDEQLLEEIAKLVCRLKIPKENFEIQMLYGRRNDLKASYRDRGYRVAVYMPVGPWYKAMPYIWRRIKELAQSHSKNISRIYSPAWDEMPLF